MYLVHNGFTNKKNNSKNPNSQRAINKLLRTQK